MTTAHQGGPGSGTIVRWLWIWITLGILVVVVVIGFLLGIVRALGSIDGGLAEASTSVKSIGQETDPLPTAIQSINTSLSGTDTSLKRIPDQAGMINDGLGKIRDSLKTITGSLQNTSGLLKITDGSLASTSSVLVGVAGATGDINRSLADTTDLLKHVRDNAGKIRETLDKAQRKDSLGTEEIPLRVKRVNGVLRPVQDDTHAVVGQLRRVDQNLLAICNSTLLILLPPQMCGA